MEPSSSRLESASPRIEAPPRERNEQDQGGDREEAPQSPLPEERPKRLPEREAVIAERTPLDAAYQDRRDQGRDDTQTAECLDDEDEVGRPAALFSDRNEAVRRPPDGGADRHQQHEESQESPAGAESDGTDEELLHPRRHSSMLPAPLPERPLEFEEPRRMVT